jgi:hypothetical protein
MNDADYVEDIIHAAEENEYFLSGYVPPTQEISAS